jgi:hypothetical protein
MATWIAPPLARLPHALEPERGPATPRIDQVLVRRVAANLVPEHGAPEWHHLGRDRGARDHQQALDQGRVAGQAQPARRRRDLPGQLDITLAHPVVVVGDRDQTDGHAVLPEIHVRGVILEARQLADRLDQPGALDERSGVEDGARAVADHAPLGEARVRVELARRDVLRHAFLRCWRSDGLWHRRAREES